MFLPVYNHQWQMNFKFVLSFYINMSRKKERRSYCPIGYVLDIVGDKWTLLIIRDILLFGKRTYGEFANSDEKIATNILADRLAILEEEGIVIKEKDTEKGSRYIYSITPKGKDLIPMMIEMLKWSATYDTDTRVPAMMVEKAKDDRERFIKDILEGLERNEFLLARRSDQTVI